MAELEPFKILVESTGLRGLQILEYSVILAKLETFENLELFKNLERFENLEPFKNLEPFEN